MSTNKNQRVDVKSVLWFIILAFGATFAIQFTQIANGVRFDGENGQYTPTLLLLTVMWIPGLAGLFVTKVIEGKSIRELVPALALRLGSVGPYLLTFLIAPLAICSMYLLTWMLGLSGFDPAMKGLTEMSGMEISQSTIIQTILPLSIFLGPLIFFIFSLGEEIGWRGFLLPRLMPLGKIRAYILLGILWGLWHGPIVYAGFNYPGHPIGGIAMMCVLTTAFGLFLNEMTLHYKSSILAAFIHGAINAQGFGIWMWVFPDANPMLGGGTGLTAIAIWLLTGFVTMKILARLKQIKTKYY